MQFLIRQAAVRLAPVVPIDGPLPVLPPFLHHRAFTTTVAHVLISRRFCRSRSQQQSRVALPLVGCTGLLTVVRQCFLGRWALSHSSPTMALPCTMHLSPRFFCQVCFSIPASSRSVLTTPLLARSLATSPHSLPSCFRRFARSTTLPMALEAHRQTSLPHLPRRRLPRGPLTRLLF